MQSLLEGKTDELPARVCDVRDVARAHVRAIEEPSASGRHIISQPNNIPSQVIVGILKNRFPHNTKLHGKDGDSSPVIDNSKVIIMGKTVKKQSSLHSFHQPWIAIFCTFWPPLCLASLCKRN